MTAGHRVVRSRDGHLGVKVAMADTPKGVVVDVRLLTSLSATAPTTLCVSGKGATFPVEMLAEVIAALSDLRGRAP